MGTATRGRSQADAAGTIRPGASAPRGGRVGNKALAFSACERPAFLGGEAAGAPAPLRIRARDHTASLSRHMLEGSFRLFCGPGRRIRNVDISLNAGFDI